MTPSLYDLLDVEPDATQDEIRAAWKHAIADLEPTDRRFRAYNDAAGILLDDDKRAAYDAELEADESEGEDESEPEETEPEEAEPEETEPESDAGAEQATGRFSAKPPQWLVGALGVLALIVVAATIWVATWPGTFGDNSPEQRQQARLDSTSSLAAAERIAPRVLGYDYRSMDDAHLEELQSLMTPAYAEEWGGVQRALREEALQQKAVVTAAVRASAVAEVGADGDQAEVLVFVDQLVQKDGRTETELQMWATLRLLREDGDWLLEKICTTDPDCSA